MHEKISYKLLALDMDGTVLNSNNEISERTVNALDDFSNLGGKVIFATGRMPSAVEKYLSKVNADSFVVSHNGALVQDVLTGELLIKKTVTSEVFEKILDYAKNENVTLHLNFFNKVQAPCATTYTKEYAKDLNIDIDETSIFNHDEFPVSALLIEKKPKLKEFLSDMQEKFKGKFDFVLIPWKEELWFLQFLAPNTSKGDSVIQAAKQFDISPSEIISFGDSYNDIELIQMSGLGIAMGNACQELKDVANDVTLSNDHDGIAIFLERLLEKGSEND